MEKYFNYSDIFLVPKMSILKTRSDADISCTFLGRKYKAPWVPANMSCVINEDIAKFLSQSGYFYIMHRFDDASSSLLKRANREKWKLISISIGIKKEDADDFVKWKAEGFRIDVVTIDIAHGHTEFIVPQIKMIRKFSPSTRIIVGNVATPEAIAFFHDLDGSLRPDAIKVGIGGGAACSTKNMTGFHLPMFSCVKNCVAMSKSLDTEFPIIADGGVRENGDFVKAMVAGADMVMAGGIFSACIDAPGATIETEHGIFKTYHGSASEHQKGEKRHVEGFKKELLCNNMTYAEKYGELKQSMQSAISYAGGKDLNCLKNVEYVYV